MRTLNIDLIYGLPGQTVESWLRSIREALQYEPEELYLYPLYVRPLTGLGRSGRAWDDHRLVCYREARALLLAQGYEQVSMRMFHRVPASDASGPLYCCQDDGMVGLGCGARSYTQRLHYASAYAVSARGVRAILADYTTRPLEAFDSADHGYWLDLDEQRRRFVIQSLLQRDGLALDDYARGFGADPLDDHPELLELQRRQLADRVGRALVLTDAGLERSDAIGPWLYSEAVRSSMEAYPWG